MNSGESDIGSNLSLAGWVFRRRDPGGLRFIDLRDRSGLCQTLYSVLTSQVIRILTRMT